MRIENIFNRLLSFAALAAYNILHPLLFLRRRLAYLRTQNLALRESRASNPRTAIVIVTYNALDYVKKCLESLEKYRPENCEIIVVDNASNEATVNYLKRKKEEGVVNKLHLSRENNYFIKGNNIGVSLADPETEYIVLLNSDVEILNSGWFNAMENLLEKRCIVSLGATDMPVVRPDGWCFMVDRRTYAELGALNEHYKMNWGITEFTGKALWAGVPVRVVVNPRKYIIHYGQKSYVRGAGRPGFNKMTPKQVVQLFGTKRVELFKVA